MLYIRPKISNLIQILSVACEIKHAKGQGDKHDLIIMCSFRAKDTQSASSLCCCDSTSFAFRKKDFRALS